MTMRLRDVRNALLDLGMRIKQSDGEFRVFPSDCVSFDEEEACAYYTDDLHDAYLTGMLMARSHYAQLAA